MANLSVNPVFNVTLSANCVATFYLLLNATHRYGRDCFEAVKSVSKFYKICRTVHDGRAEALPCSS